MAGFADRIGTFGGGEDQTGQRSRQVFLAGEGDGDAALFVLGMLTGAAVAHNFVMVGNGPLAPHIVVIGLVVVVVIGIAGREKLAPAR